jgi:hypothetical protein
MNYLENEELLSNSRKRHSRSKRKVHVQEKHKKMRGIRKVIRITPVILEFCPDLSQRVYPDINLPTM